MYMLPWIMNYELAYKTSQSKISPLIDYLWWIMNGLPNFIAKKTPFIDELTKLNCLNQSIYGQAYLYKLLYTMDHELISLPNFWG